jgi:OmpA-OmpF porin, OOP family
LTFYSFAGFGSALVNRKVNYNEGNFLNDKVALDKAAKDGPLYLQWHMGGGIKYHLTYRTTLSFEGGMRTTSTDYLDGISKSANPGSKDWYFLGLITLSQKIRWPFVKKIRGLTREVSHSRVKCPDFKVNKKVY